jgi:cytidyltransferase-like protein
VGKVVSQQDLILRCRERRQHGDKIIFAAGCFEFLHPGHIRLLEQARSYGETLVVAVLSDSSVRELVCAGGETEPARARTSVKRPITPAAERAEILAALAAVDYATETDLADLPGLLAELRPEAAVESAEPLSPALLACIAPAGGVALVRIPLEPGHSTAGIIERIVQLSGSE